MLFVIVTSIFVTILKISSVTHGLPQNFAFPRPCLKNQCQIPNTGQIGICKPFDTCVYAQYNWFHRRIHPTTCYFDQFNPIVCCPLENQQQIAMTTAAPFISTTSPSTTTTSNIIEKTVVKQRMSEKICEDIYNPPREPAADDNQFHITVVGGELAEEGEFPFMAAIGWNNIFNETEFNCGGFLLSPNFILTAAHCTILGGASPDIVRIGDEGLNSTTNSGSGTSEDFTIQRIFVHPNYNPKEIYNDIALIKLSSNASAKPVCLWQSNNIIGEYSEGEAIGYGHTQFAGARSNFLMKVTLGLIENLECSKSYPPDEKFPQRVINSQLCAGDPTGTKDTCQGDSGGPMIVYNEDYTPYAIGITSFGSGCAGGIPSIYTRISSYLDWIESIVWP